MFNPTYFPRQRWAYPKENERNFVASFFHMISIALLSLSLIRMVWFRIYGSSECSPYIMLNEFFSFGYVGSSADSHSQITYRGTSPADIDSISETNIYRTSKTG